MSVSVSSIPYIPTSGSSTSFEPIWNWAKAAGNRFLNITFGEGSSKITENIKNTVLGDKNGTRCYQYDFKTGTGIKGFLGATKDAFKEVPNTGGLNIFKNFGNSFLEIGKVYKSTDGSSWTKIKAAGGKTGPILNMLLMIGFEIPNIWRSFTHKDGGIVTGAVETGKSTLKLGASMAGFAVGSAAGGWAGAHIGAWLGTAICPGIGSVVGGIIGFAGGIIGSAITSKITEAVLGKSFTEKVEQKEQAEQQMAAQTQAQGQPAQQEIMPQFQPEPQQMISATNPFIRTPMTRQANYKDLAQLFNEYMQMQQMIQQGLYQRPQMFYNV